MVRGKTVIKRIENDTARQVTFCKRRGGLLKKAYELSVLCDAEIALIVFSPRGRLYEYASLNMSSTIDKYKETNFSESSTSTREENNAEFYRNEAEKLRKQIDMLQISKSHLKGEGLDCLELKEVKQLEMRLVRGISKVRSQIKHVKLLAETESVQERQEVELEHNNTILSLKIGENENGLQHEEEDDAGYHAIEAYLARSALQLNMMEPLEGELVREVLKGVGCTTHT